MISTILKFSAQDKLFINNTPLISLSQDLFCRSEFECLSNRLWSAVVDELEGWAEGLAVVWLPEGSLFPSYISSSLSLTESLKTNVEIKKKEFYKVWSSKNVYDLILS